MTFSHLSIRSTPSYTPVLLFYPYLLETIKLITKAENVDKTFGHQKQYKPTSLKIWLRVSLWAWMSLLDLYWIRTCSAFLAVYDSSFGVPP